jgi:hypothetical protein
MRLSQPVSLVLVLDPPIFFVFPDPAFEFGLALFLASGRLATALIEEPDTPIREADHVSQKPATGAGVPEHFEFVLFSTGGEFPGSGSH